MTITSDLLNTTDSMEQSVNPGEHWLPMLRWHLESNFYPPYDARLARPCLDAILAAKEGEPERIIAINGVTQLDGEPLTAEKLISDFRLSPLL